MADLEKLALKLATDGPVRTLPTPRLIQLLFNGVYIVKTTRAVLVWEHPYYPQLYIPHAAFTASSIPQLRITHGTEYRAAAAAATTTHDNDVSSSSISSEAVVVATQWILSVGPRSTDQVIAFSDTSLTGPAAALAGLVRVDFDAVDRWFEEAAPIFVHPKDPFKRVDILPSTRRVRVRVGGRQLADTCCSMHLYETGLPVRYYVPLMAIEPGVLRRSGTRTRCPYKGEAEYYDVVVDGEVYKDIVWYYNTPLLESARVEGLCCFYNEKVQIELDGEVLESPVTHFSTAAPNEKPSII